MFGSLTRLSSSSHLVFRTVYSQKKAAQHLFHTSSLLYNESGKKTSLYGDITSNETTKHSRISELAERADISTSETPADELEDEELISSNKLSQEEQAIARMKRLQDKLTADTDSKLSEFLKQEFKPLVATEELLTPLKRDIYLANVLKNGFFKNGELAALNGKTYKLKLTREEIDILEPSIYLKSYRIKSSTKKATLVTRLLNQLSLKDAINQCHFSHKKIAKHDLLPILKEGLDKAKQLNLDANDLYISQIWSGNDGGNTKRIEWKGRGRTGIIQHRHCHIRLVLKLKSQTLKRLEYEQSLKSQKKSAWQQLPNLHIRGVAPSFYKW